MCNLYSVTKGQQAIREFTKAVTDTIGNLPSLPGIFPGMLAPVVRNTADCRATITMRTRVNQDENPVWGEAARA